MGGRERATKWGRGKSSFSPTKKGGSVLARLKWFRTKGFHPFYRVRGHKTFYPVRGKGEGDEVAAK